MGRIWDGRMKEINSFKNTHKHRGIKISKEKRQIYKKNKDICEC
jgi:hypothetical protein